MINLLSSLRYYRCCYHLVRELSQCFYVFLDARHCVPWIRDPHHITAYRFRSPRSDAAALALLVVKAADFELETLIYPLISRVSFFVSVHDIMIYLLKYR